MDGFVFPWKYTCQLVGVRELELPKYKQLLLYVISAEITLFSWQKQQK
jgi:hypothetical protein